jgi:hypothetical protein
MKESRRILVYDFPRGYSYYRRSLNLPIVLNLMLLCGHSAIAHLYSKVPIRHNGLFLSVIDDAEDSEGYRCHLNVNAFA